jgi:hypothetical protein
MRLSIAIGGAIIAVGLVVACVPEPIEDDVQVPPEPPRETPGLEPVPGGGEEGFEVPSLTAEQIARAEEILASDPLANAILRGRHYTIDEWAPGIDSESGSNEIVGVSTLISLAEASSVEGTWLMKHDPGPGDPEGSDPQRVFVDFPECAAPNGVLKFFAVVDLTRGQLLQLEPLGVPGFDVGLRYCEGVPQELGLTD